MSVSANSFNKKIFSLLIDKARGERTLKEYAFECGISYVQMRKLFLMAQQNPPGKGLIKKLADKSVNDIEYEDFLFAAGYMTAKEQTDENQDRHSTRYDINEKIHSLTSGQRRTVEDFVDFLLKYKSGI